MCTVYTGEVRCQEDMGQMGITDAYASPEVVTAKYSGQTYQEWVAMDFCAVDIWAVGCLLAFVLTGKSWFDPDSNNVSQYQLHADWVSSLHLCSTFLTSALLLACTSPAFHTFKLNDPFHFPVKVPVKSMILFER